jgi:hypothetical protein
MDIVEGLATLDLFDQADALLRTLWHVADGGSHQFSIWRGGEWCGLEVERLLWRYRIGVWGRGFTAEAVTFFVKRRQANWAEYVMCRAGVALMGAPFNPKNRAYYMDPRGVPTAWAEKSKRG